MEGPLPLLVIILNVLQMLRFGSRRNIQSLAKHAGRSVFEKVAKGFQPLANFANCSVLDIWLSSEYNSEYTGLLVETSSIFVLIARRPHP